jgi:hypothetical protein
MDLGAISIAIIVAMVLLLLAGVPFAFVTGVIGVALCLWQFGPDSLSLLGSRAYSFLDSFTLVSVPLFIRWPRCSNARAWPGRCTRHSRSGRAACRAAWAWSASAWRW